MSTVLHIVSTCLYALVGIISLVMALESLSARGFLNFHTAAAGEPWTALGDGLQAVIVSLLRLSGMGFLIVGLQLVVVSIAVNLHPGLVVAVALPCLALLFCVGLGVINYRLHVRTGAQTPWKGSLYAAVAVAVALALWLVS